MRQYVFTHLRNDASNSVAYLTNGIGENDRLFINEIKHVTNGVEGVGIGSDVAFMMLPKDYLETTEQALKTLALDNDMDCRVYEDGQMVKNLNNTQCNLISFDMLGGQLGESSIQSVQGGYTVDIDMVGGSIDSLIAKFRISDEATLVIGDVVQESEVTVNDFTRGVEYMIISGDREATKTVLVQIVYP